MLEKMSPAARGALEPLAQRWAGFLQKLKARVAEVHAEAHAGLDPLIEAHATDHGPMGAAFSALQARFNGLGTKLGDAWDKMDEQMDEALEDVEDDLKESDWEAFAIFRSHLVNEERALLDEIELGYEKLTTEKNGRWARKLQQLAQAEVAQGAKCTSCGGPVPLETPWQASKAACSHCGVMNDVSPGLAAGLFYQGLGAHALAHEAAFDAWLEEWNAKRAFDARRCPSAYDHWVYLEAAKKYYTQYYTAGLQVHPGFTQDVAAAVAAKMKHYSAWDQPIDQQARQCIGEVVDAANRGDAAALKAAVEKRPHHVDLDDIGYALVERGLIDAAKHYFGLQYEMEDEDEPKGAWIAEKLKDAISTLR